MSTAPNLEVVEAAKADFPAAAASPTATNEKRSLGDDGTLSEGASDALVGPNGEQYPTEEELQTLRRTYGHVPWLIYTIAFVELCERFAYYGTTAVFVNFIEQPLPTEGPFPSAGAAGTNGQAGALGMGQQASTGLTLFNSFWSFMMPLVGGYFADTYWGRFKTINYAIGIATFGHIIIVISAIPQVIRHPSGALGAFIIGLVFFGIGVGFFKCNISPLIAEQYESEHPRPTVEVLPTGEKVILDPVMTISRIYMRYYLMINIGALIGQISMVYAEKYVGFWLSFTLPTIMFLFCPIVMILCRNRYVKRPPTGSVVSKAFHLWGFAMRGRWSVNPATSVRNMCDPKTWQAAKPSNVQDKPKWMTFDDAWVDEVFRGLKACAVFVWFPIFWLAYSQMLNNLVSQAATMKLGGVPNDVVNNLDPFALMIFIPLLDKVVYPFVARLGFNFTPLKKVTGGFLCSTLSMIAAAVIQHYIYKTSPCGNQASSCDQEPPISVWAQTPAYVLIAFSEIFASITGLEYAFTKAPKNMRSLVTGIFLFTNAFSSAIAQAFIPLAKDPLLVWLYTTIAIISCIGGIGFWLTFRKQDKQEDALNALPESTFKGRRNIMIDEESVKTEQEIQDKIRKAQGLA